MARTTTSLSTNPETELSGGRRLATKERNREAILAAGLEVFSSTGFGEATIRDLIRASGLSTGTFYNYFPDKLSVLRALVDRSVTRLNAKLSETRASATTPETFVSSGFKVFFEYLASDPTLFALLSRNAGAVRQILDEPIMGAGIGELTRDLEAAVARGDLPRFNPELMSAAMAGAALELGVAMIEKKSATPQQAAEFATKLFLGGIVELTKS
jgi:AcrR family transcriptional regulator